MKSPMIMEAKPVDHFVFGLTTAGKAHSMEPSSGADARTSCNT